ncbi:hypothetical protein GEMRC1_005565 [Eukaryota sp. GEM-RC1]
MSPFSLLLISFSFSRNTFIILDEPSLCNQTISFGEESIEVNKSVLAAHSTYFQSLWFLEFGDKLENPIDFFHLPVDSNNNNIAFLKSFFGKSFILNENNAYNFFYLAHYFQVDKLIHDVENHLNTHLLTWAWLKSFIKEADKINDLRALEFVGPFLNLKMIRFSPTKKHSQLQVSGDGKRVVVGSGGFVYRNILGEDPLLPGNEYTWKLRYKGYTHGLYVGVIDESKFKVDGGVGNAHCFGNASYVYGCLSGTKTKWNPGELLEINANLINYTLTIKSVSNSSINLTGTLPSLNSGNYYAYVFLHNDDYELEIVE